MPPGPISPIPRVFDLHTHVLSLAAIPFRGFPSGDALTMEFASDDWEFEQGADGEVLFMRKHNAVVNVALRIAQGNPLIDTVNGLHKASLDVNGIMYPFDARDVAPGGTEVVSGNVMILQYPRKAWADSPQHYEVKMALTPTTWQGGALRNPASPL